MSTCTKLAQAKVSGALFGHSAIPDAHFDLPPPQLRDTAEEAGDPAPELPPGGRIPPDSIRTR